MESQGRPLWGTDLVLGKSRSQPPGRLDRGWGDCDLEAGWSKLVKVVTMRNEYINKPKGNTRGGGGKNSTAQQTSQTWRKQVDLPLSTRKLRPKSHLMSSPFLPSRQGIRATEKRSQAQLWNFCCVSDRLCSGLVGQKKRRCIRYSLEVLEEAPELLQRLLNSWGCLCEQGAIQRKSLEFSKDSFTLICGDENEIQSLKNNACFIAHLQWSLCYSKLSVT